MSFDDLILLFGRFVFWYYFFLKLMDIKLISFYDSLILFWDFCNFALIISFPFDLIRLKS
jgi:hypothetical protein